MRCITFVAVALASAVALAAPAAFAQSGAPAPPPSEAPAAPPSEPPAAPPSVAVRYEPSDPAVRWLSLSSVGPVDRAVWGPGGLWMQRTFAPFYARVCDGPCTAHLAPGTYQFALAKGDRTIVVPEAFVLAEPSLLHADFQDRSALRDAGAIVGVAGVVGGIVMIVASTQVNHVCGYYGTCGWSGSVDVPLFASGVGVLVGSLVVGSVLLAQRDVARILVEPLRF